MATQKTPDQAVELAGPFAEISPQYTSHEAKAEAARCLFCFDAPCTRACPADIDVPKFIRQLLYDDPMGAAETILTSNIFGGACARACPTEVLCEGACVENTRLNEPIKIGRLQRYTCDAAAAAGASFFSAPSDTGHKIAIVGGGPAGLTCAHELRKRGHSVTVFETRKMAGGIHTYGIARYKYNTTFALSEVDRVMQIGGIDLRLNTPVGASQISELLASHDAVFLSIGLGKTASLGIEGEDLAGVWEALDFIFQTRTQPLDKCVCGENVLVIGGGNTAVDVATTAVRLGAKRVTIAYRRTAAEMPAFAYEYELTKSDGIVWEFSSAPLRIVGSNGTANGVEFARTQADGEGRSARLKTVPDSNFTLEADMIVKALGQTALSDQLEAIPDLKLDKGKIVVDPETGETSIPGLFAGGDCTGQGAEIVDAVAQAKIAAAGIHAKLASPTKQ